MNSSDWLSMILGGLPIAVSSFCAAVYMYVSPNILKYARGDIEVGIYGAGYKLISVFLLIPTVLSQVLYPLFSEFHAHSRHKLGKALDDALRVTFEISLPLAVGTVVLAPAIIAFLFPPEYAGSATVLRAIIIGNVVGYQAWVLYAFQLATGNQKFCMWNSLIVAVLVTATSFGVVPRFGYVGVALIVGGTDVILFINHAIYAKHLGYSIIKPGIVVRVMSSSTLMFIVVWYLRNQFLPVPIIAGMLVYGVALYFSGSIGEQERSIIGKIMRRVGMGN
jgi:PST family polysaccharide transporter